jgi:DtxR family transcriptional regulator, Mn-dependent transcriptional regulator
MPLTLTHAVEDYLKAIYDLTTSGNRASTNDLAERLAVAPASVTGMLKKLAAVRPPLVKYEKHRGAFLTSDGEKAALEIIRHHRLLELFLHETLGYSWDEVHAEADRLEHVISEEMEERISQSLGHPSRDPHGEPIPSRDLLIPHIMDVPLSSFRRGDSGIVERVESSDLDLLRYLEEVGLMIGARFSVQEYSRFDDNIHIQVEGKQDRIVLGTKVTRQVYVSETPN